MSFDLKHLDMLFGIPITRKLITDNRLLLYWRALSISMKISFRATMWIRSDCINFVVSIELCVLVGSSVDISVSERRLGQSGKVTEDVHERSKWGEAAFHIQAVQRGCCR